MSSISELQFRALCDDAFRDRRQIYPFNPGAPHAETVLWTIMGSLYSLLSLGGDDLPTIAEPTADAYADAICTVVETFRDGEYDPRTYLNELIKKIEADDRPTSK